MRMFSYRSFWQPDIALDMGTARTRVLSGKNNLLTVPSSLNGRAAVCAGLIVDPDATVAMLSPLLARVRRFGLVRPHAVVCAPSHAGAKEVTMLQECLNLAGASSVVVVPEPLAAAIGSGADVASPYSGMIVDIGEGVTDCAVFRSGKIIEKHAVKAGCSNLRKALLKELTRRAKIHISRDEAERIMRGLGVAQGSGSEGVLEIAGCLERGTAPITVKVSDKDIRHVLAPVIDTMVNAVRALFKTIPHALQCEVIESGIWLSGGGALLRGMKERLEMEMRININVAPQPLEAVVRGAHDMLPVVSLLNRW